jgi:NitT/TauT family transport system substrate-binding protein
MFTARKSDSPGPRARKRRGTAVRPGVALGLLVLSVLVAAGGCAKKTTEAAADPKSGTPAAPAVKEHVNISIFSWPGYGFWFVAKEKNLAPELDFDIQIIEDPIQSYTIMASGKLDVVSSTIEYGPIAAETKNPARIVTFANLSYGTDKLVLGPSGKSAADLKGKSVAVMQGGLSQIYMGIWLNDNGVDIGQVKFMNLVMDDAAAAMISGKVAGAELWEPFGGKVLSTLKGAKVVAQSKEPAWLERALLADAMYMSSDFIQKRRPVAEATLRAYYAALDYWMKHPGEANAIIASGIKFEVKDVESVLGTTGKSQEGGLYMYDLEEAARFMGVKPGAPPFGQSNGQIKKHFSLTNEWWLKFGLVKSLQNFEDGVDTSVIAAIVR